MDEEDLKKRLGAAMGEAMFSGLLLPALWKMLIDNGTVSKESSDAIIDHLLLILERERQRAPGDLVAIDHARSRLETLLTSRSGLPQSEPKEGS